MPASPHYRLRIKSLKFISAVDAGAQGPIANVALIKRAPGQAGISQAATGDLVDSEVNATCKVVKVDEKMGLVFGWALATTLDGGTTPHVDYQDDAIVGDDELIKVAADFMEASAASDVMHDDKPDGKIVFAMPLTREVNTALGIKSDVHGLAIAMRPSPETFKRFVSKELNAFSIGGIGERTMVKAKPGKKRPVRAMRGRYGKQTVLTSVEDGHQHGLDVRQVCDRWYSGLTTSYATSDGAEDGHCHAWVFDRTTGAITIAMDSGHSHSVDAVVPADVLAAFAAQEAKPPTDDKDCAPVCESDSGGSGPTVLAISMRAPSGDSSPSDTTSTVKSKETNAMPDAKDNQIAELEKRSARLEKLATLNDAQRAHFGKLSGSEAEAFLSKSSHERDVVLAEIEKANEVVYTSPVDGSVYRKNDDRRLIEMAKRNDETTAALKAETIAKREAEFARKGDEVLTAVAKGLKGDLRGRIMKALNTEFADPKEYEEAVAAIKGLNFAAANLSKATGVNPGVDPTRPESPQGQLDALVAKHAADNKVTVAKAYTAVLGTPEGAALYKQLPVGRGQA